MRLLLPVLLLWGSAVYSATVYRTVDENGVVSFSDTPPEGDTAAEALQIDVPAAQSPDTYLDNLEAMRETTDRMAQDRREREKHRAELRKMRAAGQPEPLPLPVSQGYSGYTSYYPAYPVYRPRPGIPPWRPGHRPGPEHPIARPPLYSGPGVYGSSNSQLMRPIVSSPHRGASNAQLQRPMVSAPRD